jgi:hypothetical protein
MAKFLICILLFTINTLQAQKYVSNSNGDDGNLGSISQPYKTIKKGVNSCPPNQTVYVDPGIYNSLIDINITINTSQNGITVTKWLVGAPNTGDVVIDAINQIGLNNNVNIINVIGASNITIDNIKMKRLKGIEVTGIKVENGGDSIKILNCSFENIGWEFNALSILPPTSNLTQTYSISAIKIINSTSIERKNVYIQNNTIFNCSVGYGEAITIVGNINGFVVSNNLVHDISNIGIDAAGNQSYVNGRRSRNGIISTNEVYRCMSAKGVSAGIYLDGSDSCIVEKNKCHHNGVGISFGAEESYLPNTTPRGHIIRNNLVYNNSIFGMVLGANGGRTVQAVRVYNNLLFKNRTFDTINNIISIGIVNPINLLIDNPSFGGEISFQNSDNLVLKNNIIYRLNNRRAWNVPTGFTVSNFTCNNNNYFQDIYSDPIIDMSGATFNGSIGLSQNNPTLSIFQTNWPGLETNATAFYPVFIDTAQKNFRLNTTSPLINKGEFPSLSTIVGINDYYGNTRLLCDTIDIGANEVIVPIPVITNQPINVATCLGSNATFTVTATGSNLIYRWQESNNGGSTWNNVNNGGIYTGANTNILTLNSVISAMNNHRYRCIITGFCNSINSSFAILTVNTPPSTTTEPINSAICANQNTSFSVSTTGTNTTYQWQISTSGCTGLWLNLNNSGNYSGVTTNILALNAIPVSFNGYGYRCIVSGTCTPQATSNCATLTVSTAINIVTQPSNIIVCNGSSATFTVVANGNGINYQWQVSTNGGSSFSNIVGQVQPTLNLSSVSQAMNGNLYRCILSTTSNCIPNITSSNASLVVNSSLPITISGSSNAICEGGNLTLNASSGFPNYTWTPVGTGNTASVIISPNSTTSYTVTGTGSNGCTSTATTIITVTPKPIITALTASPHTNLPKGQTTTITVTASSTNTTNLNYIWNYSGSGPSQVFSGNTHVVDFASLGLFTVRVSEVANPACISLPKSIQINSLNTDTSRMTIYPNVNNGFFHLRFYNNSGIEVTRLISIYDSRGALIYSAKYIVAVLSKTFDIDLRRISSGTYHIKLLDETDKIIESKGFIIAK